MGKTLTAAPGTWGPSPVTVTYQWYRGATAIPKATAKTYVLTSSDKKKSITVAVTGAKTGYRTVSTTSKAVVIG